MYIKLNEQTQTIEYPPINKDNICNYNMDIELLLVDGYVDIEQGLIDLLNQGKGRIKNNTIVDITDTQEYISAQRLKKINEELLQADLAYATILETPVEYTNGFLYQPKHIQTYAILIASNTSSQDIWDYTELNVVNMTNAQLKALATFLSVIAEPAFQARKIARKALLEEKLLLQS